MAKRPYFLLRFRSPTAAVSVSPAPNNAMDEGSGIVVILETGSACGVEECAAGAHPGWVQTGRVWGLACEAGAAVCVKAMPKASVKSATSLSKAILKIN
jgi:hypothetical protein